MSEAQPVPEIPSETLQAKINSLKAITNAHDLIHRGQFPGSVYERIKQAAAFLESLHKQLTAEFKADPQAHLFNDLLREEMNEN